MKLLLEWLLFACCFVETSLFADVRSVGTWLIHHQIIDQQNVSIYIYIYIYILWWQMFFNNSFYIASFGVAINFLIWTSFLLFKLFYLSTWFLCFDHWMICHSLTNWPVNLFLNFWLFLVLFWMFWMHKSCCVPHVSQITNWGTIFTKRLYSVSKEWVRSWSQAFLITYDKTLTKKLLAFHPEKVMRRKKIKK